MEEKMAGAAAGFLLQELKELIQYNADLLSGLGIKAIKLNEDLDLMKGFVEQYTESHTDSYILQPLATQLRRLVQETEVAVEKYVICETLQKSRNTWSRFFHSLSYVSDLRDAGKRIEKLSADVSQFFKVKAPLAKEALKNEGPTKIGEKKEAIFVEEDKVVGFEDRAEKVIELLTGESEKVEVVSIDGGPGVGKTTLAKEVLNDPKFEYDYTRKFVHVSRKYERREVFVTILSAFTQITPEINRMPVDDVIMLLRKELEKRKYLIVMDDIWTKEAWVELSVAFPFSKKSSRILITTRSAEVAQHATTLKEPYRLHCMTPEEGRKLLRRKVFGQDECPPGLKEHESRILETCDGLPLAIVAVAGILLNHREDGGFWEKVANDVKHYVARKESELLEVIEVIFNRLPRHLKPCLLYLGVFPKDMEIPTLQLLRLWIAEGFIEGDGRMTLEDIAEHYLKELVERSLVMVGKRRSNGLIKTCRIHYTLGEFCKSKASKENLFQEFPRFDSTTFLNDLPRLQPYRRISINSSTGNYSQSSPFGEGVRSFLTFTITLSGKDISSILKNFRVLRVLDVRPVTITEFPKQLLSLVLLRHIALCCSFNVLPKKLSVLRNLQTIIIETQSPTLEIKADIWEIPHLRHLQTNASISLQNVEGHSSAHRNLQTLSTISVESCTVEVLERTPTLKKLGIRGKLATIIDTSGDSILFGSPNILGHLENLKLLNEETTSGLCILPMESKFPENLKKLTLLNTLLHWRHMSTLGKLANLQVLNLKDKAFQGDQWDTEDRGFRCLEVLKIGSTDLKRWNASASHFQD